MLRADIQAAGCEPDVVRTPVNWPRDVDGIGNDVNAELGGERVEQEREPLEWLCHDDNATGRGLFRIRHE